MNIEELEEELSNILVAGYELGTDKNGQLIIYTGLRQDDEGELHPFEDDEEDDEDEEDPDFDPDFEPLEDEDEDDDDDE